MEDGECSGQHANTPAGWASFLELKTGNAASWKDYTIECKAMLIEKLGKNTGFGISFRGVGSYAASIELDLEKVRFWEAGAVKEAIPFPFDIAEDTWYKLKVIAEGDHFEFYINDELIGSFDDDSRPSGRVELTVKNAHVHFDDVVITGPEIPDGGPGGVSISVRQKDKLATMWGTLKQKR